NSHGPSDGASGALASSVADPNTEPSNKGKGHLFMGLLAFQFGLQPLLQKACLDKDAVNKTSFVIVAEIIKIFLCLLAILSGGPRACRAMFRSWSLQSSVVAAAVPAVLYALQNWLAQLAYMNLDSLTYNLLNQTKTLFAAICLYVVMGRKQSMIQILALTMLLCAALLLNARGGSNGKDGGKVVMNPGGGKDLGMDPGWMLMESRLWLGILPVMMASFLSGLSASITQRTLQWYQRNSYLFSMELAIYGIIALSLSTLKSGDGQKILKDGFLHGWTPLTILPAFTQAAGGLVVGQVIKYAGSVQKGFALIAGIIITASAQTIMENTSLTMAHWMSAALVAAGTYLHTNYPPRQPNKNKSL
ncbi:unnamed protein product, partial [Choristocarpus tenellus]